eukprot:TRINITY_DN7846_c0_g1_i1.p1 TRINITY_DN7846_c0_g1~~TRINITY_DN7846_c0_g1_i1.p1  ORF type:complete len:329 (-),score=26.15 TRINITY_DN7846_c0_g1_i1:131-1117(-)
MGEGQTSRVTFSLLLTVLLASCAFCSGRRVTVSLGWLVPCGPYVTTIYIGDTVQWTWQDYAPHSVQALNTTTHEPTTYFSGEGGGTSVVTEYGFVYSHTFTEAGFFEYDCVVHGSSMSGSITVKKVTHHPYPPPPARKLSPPPPPPTTVAHSPPPPKSRGRKTVSLRWLEPCGPYVTTIYVGDTVQWTWQDSKPHSVQRLNLTTYKPTTYFSGKGGGTNTVAKYGFVYSHTFTEAGFFAYQCAVHGQGMSGTVLVNKVSHHPHPPPPKKLSSPPPPKGLKPTHIRIPWFLGVTKRAASATLAVGSTVSWVWGDKLPHSVEGKSCSSPS